MPHLRPRFALEPLLRKLKFSRIVSIQGARQTGKSVLARDLFKGFYLTFDKSRVREQAQNRIGVFLESTRQSAHGQTVVIDEAQKVPHLFDEIKAIVDVDQSSGQFLLLGSTEFSRETKINESLTGRLSRLKLYPLTFAEAMNQTQGSFDFLKGVSHKKFQRSDFIKHLLRGGFPSIFSVRDESERVEKIDEWLKLTCERDVLQIPKLKPDSDLCYRILEALAHLEEPSAASLANRLRVSSKRILSNLKALSLIFSIHEVKPSTLGTGKTLFYLIDSALVARLGGGIGRQIESSILTELLAKKAYQKHSHFQINYYRSRAGSRVNFLIQKSPASFMALKVMDTEKIDMRDFLILDSLKSKLAREKIECQTGLVCGIDQNELIKIKNRSHWAISWETVF